jgi:hypothetical protein
MKKEAIAKDVEQAFSDAESPPSMAALREAFNSSLVAKLGYK